MKTQFVYLASAALFILSIKWMSQVRSSRRGNWAGSLAMLLAVAGTLAYTGITSTSAAWVGGPSRSAPSSASRWRCSCR